MITCRASLHLKPHFRLWKAIYKISRKDDNIKEVLVQQEGKTISTDEESYSEKQMLHFKILW